jgi:hypothetical protein
MPLESSEIIYLSYRFEYFIERTYEIPVTNCSHSGTALKIKLKATTKDNCTT